MAKKIVNIIADYKLKDNKRECEDVTSVTLPTIEHPTTSIDVAGVPGAIDLPDQTRVNSMEISVAHNNGTNCAMLATGGAHTLDFRVARSVYTVSKGEQDYDNVKYVVKCLHKSTEKGQVETGNPLGSTDKFEVLRLEEIVNGKTVTLIDKTADTITINGVDNRAKIRNILN